MEIFHNSWNALQTEAALYPASVQLWMRIMALSFGAGIVFVPWKNGARWIVAALMVNMLGLIVVKAVFPELSRTIIGTIIHLVFWSFALWMVWNPSPRNIIKTEFASIFGRVYIAWLIWVSSIMAVSLVLDARTAIKIVF